MYQDTALKILQHFVLYVLYHYVMNNYILYSTYIFVVPCDLFI